MAKYKCVDCGKEMNAVERMLGPVCGKCTDKKFEAITGVKRQRGKRLNLKGRD